MADAPIDKNRANNDPRGTRPGKMRERWASLTDEERSARAATFASAAQAKWQSWSPERRQAWIEKTAAGRRASTLHPRAVAKGRYRASGLADEEIEYLLSLPQPERKQARIRQRDYGISPLQYRDLVALQSGRCALCESTITGKDCHVDHDHQNGMVRGLLCASCNLSLGHVETKGVEWVGRAYAYIATKRGPGGAGCWEVATRKGGHSD